MTDEKEVNPSMQGHGHGGKRAQKGDTYRCSHCGCQFVCTHESNHPEEKCQNPTCCCGHEMQKDS